MTLEELFWSKVQRGSFDECWPWTRGGDGRGYGGFHVPPGCWGVPLDCHGGRRVKAHRVAFYLVHGHWPAPFGLHGCDNPPCCNAENPEHVHEGTHGQNMQERERRGRRSSHLPTGVPLAGESHPGAKLTRALVEEIRLRGAGNGLSGRHHRGPTQEQLALEYDVSQKTISNVLRGGWEHD